MQIKIIGNVGEVAEETGSAAAAATRPAPAPPPPLGKGGLPKPTFRPAIKTPTPEEYAAERAAENRRMLADKGTVRQDDISQPPARALRAAIYLAFTAGNGAGPRMPLGESTAGTGIFSVAWDAPPDCTKIDLNVECQGYQPYTEEVLFAQLPTGPSYELKRKIRLQPLVQELSFDLTVKASAAAIGATQGPPLPVSVKLSSDTGRTLLEETVEISPKAASADNASTPGTWEGTLKRTLRSQPGEASFTLTASAAGFKEERRAFNLSQISGAHTVDLTKEAVVQEVWQTDACTNDSRLWLTYEARFNWPRFLKSPGAFQMRLFETDVQNVLLVLASKDDGLDDETLGNLAKTFFPDLADKPDRLRSFGRAPWEDRGREPFPPLANGTQHASGSQAQVVTGRMRAVFPYNLRDNTLSSRAIGTHRTWKFEDGSATIVFEPLADTMKAWSTASRSSIAQVLDAAPGRTKAEQTTRMWRDDLYADELRTRFTDSAAEPLPHALDVKRVFSVKTDVELIGFQNQHSVGKDKLEHNSILAAQRSAFIRFVERDKGYPLPEADPNLAILTELMTVTLVHPRWDDWLKRPGSTEQPMFGDGYQVRSLRGLKSGKEYFPPTSIPFVEINDGVIQGGRNEVKWRTDEHVARDDKLPVTAAFTKSDDPEWRAFWKQHYAEVLGRAKSRLLLRYGLQGFGGNAQNFLLETEAGRPTGRIVIRDMGDYALHDYVLWAIYGKGTVLPPSPRAREVQESLVATWATKFQHVPILAFECDLHAWKNDKGHSEFPTFTGYHRDKTTDMGTFNPFCPHCEDGTKFVGHISPLWAYAMPVSPNIYQDLRSDSTQWAKVFSAEMEWGIAHAQAWIGRLEGALKTSFGFSWETQPVEQLEGCKECRPWLKDPCAKHKLTMFAPGDYERVAPDEWSALFDKFKIWEMALGWGVEAFLATAKGQQAIRDYVKQVPAERPDYPV